MHSTNPVFSRTEGFNGRGGTAYADFGQAPAPHTPVGTGTGRITIDSVVQKTGITLGIVVLEAVATWILTGDVFSTTTGVVDTGVNGTL